MIRGQLQFAVPLLPPSVNHYKRPKRGGGFFREKLARALEEAHAPAQMVERARAGQYDDFLSDSATPIINLVRDLQLVGLHELANRAMNGEFDGTKEEADAWYQAEGKDLL